MNKKLLHNEDGSALVMVLIIGAILLALIGTYASFMYHSKRANKAQENRKDFSQIQAGVSAATGQIESVSGSEQLQFSSPPPQ